MKEICTLRLQINNDDMEKIGTIPIKVLRDQNENYQFKSDVLDNGVAKVLVESFLGAYGDISEFLQSASQSFFMAPLGVIEIMYKMQGANFDVFMKAMDRIADDEKGTREVGAKT